jgi:ABC-type transport system involved in multi-copper enzyme maturation permease subunit
MRQVAAIALNTAREAVRNRILYSIVFFAVLMVGISAVFGAASIGDQVKYMKDFSLMSVSLFGVIIAVVLGVNLLHQELGKRTIVNILSKPVARWQFLLGKFLGLFSTLLIVVGIMAAGVVSAFALFTGALDWALAVAAGAALLEIMIVTAVAVFFSSLVVTPSLAGMFTAATFIAGRSSGYLLYFINDEHPPAVRMLAHGLYWALPRLDHYAIADQVVYGQMLPPEYLGALVGYACAYTGALLLLSVAVFSRREFV